MRWGGIFLYIVNLQHAFGTWGGGPDKDHSGYPELGKAVCIMGLLWLAESHAREILEGVTW
jgi:hypothetical protein